MEDNNLFFFKGNENILEKKDKSAGTANQKIQESFSKVLDGKNLSFLLGCGCSSYIADGKEIGIPTMLELAKEFYNIILSKDEVRWLSTTIKLDTSKEEFAKNIEFFLSTLAKEGRKFGMFLMISSQRPSELSKTVLSQCSNFIVHRIQNPEDLSHIRQITPHISDTILKRMPSIPTQHALIFGHAVNLPTTFKVNEAKPKPKSDNNKVSENWFQPSNFIAYNIS